MPGKSFRIARIAGIPVGVSPWWLVIVALITWSLGADYFPEVVHGIAPGVSYALGLASALLLFASILVHEFGHALVARRHGIQVDEIDLWLLGGVAMMHGDAHDPGTELRYALAGRGFGYLLIVLGALEVASGFAQGLWLAVIGFFLVGAAGAQSVSAQVRTVFSGVDAASLMSSPVVTIPAELSLERAVRDYFVPYRYTAFPVADAQGRHVVLLTLAQLQAVPAERRASLRVGELADRDPQLTILEHEDVSGLLERPLFARVGRAVVVDPLGAPMGLLSITDVERSLRAYRLADRVSPISAS